MQPCMPPTPKGMKESRKKSCNGMQLHALFLIPLPVSCPLTTLTHIHSAQFNDVYRATERFDTCMVPGNVIDNAFTDGARAICGGMDAGITTLPLVDSDNNIVGKLLIWRSLSGSVFFTVKLSCGTDGSMVGRALWSKLMQSFFSFVAKIFWYLWRCPFHPDGALDLPTRLAPCACPCALSCLPCHCEQVPTSPAPVCLMHHLTLLSPCTARV
eukprot:356542-Chlamydomonas_euryale.AAC.1